RKKSLKKNLKKSLDYDMRKINLLFIIFTILLGCNNIDNNNFNQLIDLFKKNEINIVKVDKYKESVFTDSLLHKNPLVYSNEEGNMFFFFVYKSEKNAQKALEDFEKKTESMNILNHKKY